MPIRVKCDGCEKQFSVKNELAGKKLRCPNCRSVIVVSADLSAKRPSKRMDPPASPKATATTATTARTQAVPPASKTAKATCPSCKKVILPGATTCPHCKFNLKLGRKLSISAAIDNANVKPGVRADGTHYKTRSEKAKERNQAGRRLRLALWCVIGGVVGLLGLIILVVALTAKAIPDLNDLIEEGQVASVGDDPVTFHPLRVGYSLSLKIPLDEISIEPVLPPLKDATDLSTGFVETNCLPYVHLTEDARIFGVVGEAIAQHVEAIDGAFDPDAIKAGVAMKEKVVWRRATELTESGSLTGALLDLGKSRAARVEELKPAIEACKARAEARKSLIERKMAEWDRAHANDPEGPDEIDPETGELLPSPRVRYQDKLEVETPPAKTGFLTIDKGKLTFVISRLQQMQGGPRTYAEAVRANSDRVRNPEARTKKDDTVVADIWIFHPVIVAPTTIVENDE